MRKKKCDRPYTSWIDEKNQLQIDLVYEYLKPRVTGPCKSVGPYSIDDVENAIATTIETEHVSRKIIALRAHGWWRQEKLKMDGAKSKNIIKLNPEGMSRLTLIATLLGKPIDNAIEHLICSFQSGSELAQAISRLDSVPPDTFKTDIQELEAKKYLEMTSTGSNLKLAHSEKEPVNIIAEQSMRDLGATQELLALFINYSARSCKFIHALKELLKTTGIPEHRKDGLIQECEDLNEQFLKLNVSSLLPGTTEPTDGVPRQHQNSNGHPPNSYAPNSQSELFKPNHSDTYAKIAALRNEAVAKLRAQHAEFNPHNTLGINWDKY